MNDQRLIQLQKRALKRHKKNELPPPKPKPPSAKQLFEEKAQQIKIKAEQFNQQNQ